MTFRLRRITNIVIAFVIGIALLGLHQGYDTALYQQQFLSGWLLLISIFALTLYNARKKVSMVPLGTNATWLQFHIYLGFISLLLFLIHIEWRLPNGWLEGLLAVFFLGVALSGIVGIYLSRTVSRQLTRRGEELIFERIPVFIAELRQQAEELVVQAAVETGSSTLADHYQRHLAGFFGGTRNTLQHLRGSRRPMFEMINNIASMERYLNDKEQAFSSQLRDLVEKKDEVDYHYALQGALKGWLFVHIPMTYGMIVLALVHMTLAYAFSGGV